MAAASESKSSEVESIRLAHTAELEASAAVLRTTSHAHATERDAVVQRAEDDKRTAEALRSELVELQAAHEAAAAQSAAAVTAASESESSEIEKLRLAHTAELEASATQATEAAAVEMARAQQLIRRAASALAEQTETQSKSIVDAHQAEIEEIRASHAAELEIAAAAVAAEASREANMKASEATSVEMEAAQRLIRQASVVLHEQNQAKALLHSESKEHASMVAGLQALTLALEATAVEKAAEAALHKASLRSEMTDSRATHQAAVTSLDDSHRQKLAELSAMHTEALQSEQQSLQLAHAEELETIRSSEASKLVELESSLRLELERSSLSELRTSSEAQMQSELEELRASHAAALQAAKEAAAAEAAEKESRLRTEVDELTQAVAIAAREVVDRAELSMSVTMVPVTVPDGVGPGDTLEIEWEGSRIEVEVPDGLTAGDVFTVAIDQEEPDATSELADAAAEWKAAQVADWEAEQAGVSPEQVGRSRRRSRKALIREMSAQDDHSLIFISHDHLQFSPGSTPDASPIPRGSPSPPTARPQSPLTLMPEASFTDGQPARPREVLKDMLLRLEQLQSTLAESPVPVTSGSFVAEGVPPDSRVEEEKESEAVTLGNALESVDVSPSPVELSKEHVSDQSNEVAEMTEGVPPQGPDEVLAMLLRIEELQQDLAEAAEAGATPAKPQRTRSQDVVVLST